MFHDVSVFIDFSFILSATRRPPGQERGMYVGTFGYLFGSVASWCHLFQIRCCRFSILPGKTIQANSKNHDRMLPVFVLGRLVPVSVFCCTLPPKTLGSRDQKQDGIIEFWGMA